MLLATVLLALAGGCAEARSLRLTAQRLHTAQASAQTLHLVLDERGDAATLQLSAARLEVPALALAGRLDWTCTLRVDAGGRACAGPVRLAADNTAGQLADLEARLNRERVDLVLRKDGREIALTVPFGTAPLSLSLRRVPSTWLEAPLAQFWPAGELRGGTLDADLRRDADGQVEATYSAGDLSLNSGDGAFAAAALTANGRFAWNPVQADARLVAETTLHGGALQFGALKVRLPDTPVDAKLDALRRADGRWQVARFAWDDPAALTFEASAEIEPTALAALRALSVRIEAAHFPLALERYAQGVLTAQGFGGLGLKGGVRGEFAVDADDGVQRIALDTDTLDIDDRANGVRLDGLRGGIDWAPHGDRPAKTLAWRRARIGELPLPAVSARWQVRDGAWHLLGALTTRLLGGTLSLRETVLDPRADTGERVRSTFALRGIGYDSADGTLALAHLAVDGSIRVAGNTNEPRVRVDAVFSGGEALAGPVYVQLPATPVRTMLDATLKDARWHVDRFDWNDPGVLELQATADLAPTEAQPLQALQLELRRAALGPALERYARSWLAAKGYAELAATGTLSGSLGFDGAGVQRFAFAAQAVGLRDGAGRFAFGGVEGGVDWRLDDDAPATTLGWTSAELFRIPLGAARATLESRRRAITLAQPLAVDVLGGVLRLEKLSLLPRSPRGERYAGSFAIAGIEMAQLSSVLGWPHFPGNLSGGIPEIVFAGDTIELRGGLDLYVFDGHLGVSGVRLERPFGVAPSLGADVHFENLDLAQVTSAFSFGGMSGRLMGTIAGLRLVDWSPVAFDAWLRTSGGGRMSYKAVDDITAIGGGGLSANLQTMALKLFDTFGYRRLGLRCLLRDEVCLMGGIDPVPPDAGSSSDGYTIVEGAGIPRISIVGHRRRVDWPTLVRRLQEATQGQGPVIQ